MKETTFRNNYSFVLACVVVGSEENVSVSDHPTNLVALAFDVSFGKSKKKLLKLCMSEGEGNFLKATLSHP